MRVNCTISCDRQVLVLQGKVTDPVLQEFPGPKFIIEVFLILKNTD